MEMAPQTPPQTPNLDVFRMCQIFYWKFKVQGLKKKHQPRKVRSSNGRLHKYMESNRLPCPLPKYQQIK